MHSSSPLLLDLQAWDAATSDERRAALVLVAGRISGQFRFEKVERFSCGGQAHDIAIFTHRKTGIPFHLLPGGWYEMGNSPAETEVCERNDWSGDIDEFPSRSVRVSPFLASRFLVTESAWKAHGGAALHFNFGDAHPVDAISRKQGRDWSEKNGLRLLTEAEWEYACRAGTTSVFYWGDAPDPSHVWMKDHPTPDEYRNYTEAEHAGKTNAFGMVDMLGSLAEWVEDDMNFYDELSDNSEAFRAEADDPDGIQRGGCFMYGWNLCRCSTRIQCSDYGDTGMGLRVACSIGAARAGEAPEGEAVVKIVMPGEAGHASSAKGNKKEGSSWWKIWENK